MADMEIKLLGAASVSDSTLQTAFDGLEEAVTHLESKTSISDNDTVITKLNTSHSLNCSDRWNDSESYLDAHGFDKPTHYVWLTGCLQSAANKWGGWDQSTRTQAFVSTSYHNGTNLQAATVHEAFHPFIDERLSDVQDMIEGMNNDHALGEIYRDPSQGYFITPMLYTYKSQYSGVGDCSSSYTSTTKNSLIPSDCTATAMEMSRDANI